MSYCDEYDNTPVKWIFSNPLGLEQDALWARIDGIVTAKCTKEQQKVYDMIREGCTRKEIGVALGGRSNTSVRQIICRIVKKIKKELK